MLRQAPPFSANDSDRWDVDAMLRRHEQLSGLVAHTPTVQCTSRRIAAQLAGTDLKLKLECFQHTGTFKARGALSSCMSIPRSKRRSGITATSAGNHAIACAWAADQLGLSAKIVMQDGANPFRVRHVNDLGAEIVFVPDLASAFAEAHRLADEEGRTFVHPFEGHTVSLGTAGIGIELIRDAPDLDAVVVSVGGGGLIGGIAAAIKTFKPDCLVYGVEPIGAANLSRSLAQNSPVTMDRTDTIADSLAPPMCTPFSFALCARYVDDVVTVTDDQICAALCLMQEEQKLAAEPAAAAALAGILFPLRDRLGGKRVGQIVCGANIGHSDFSDCLRHGGSLLENLGI